MRILTTIQPYIRPNNLFFIFSDECEDDSDCNSHGSCIDLESISSPRKQCFCDAGWFGLKCAQGKYQFQHCTIIIIKTMFVYLPFIVNVWLVVAAAAVCSA